MIIHKQITIIDKMIVEMFYKEYNLRLFIEL